MQRLAEALRYTARSQERAAALREHTRGAGAAEGEPAPAGAGETLRQKDWQAPSQKALLAGERQVTGTPGEPAHRRGKRPPGHTGLRQSLR